MTKKKSNAGKVFDVAKPGTSKPDIGSKPMIIGHKSTVADPMMKEAGIEPKASDVQKVSQSAGVKIEPVSDDMKDVQGPPVLDSNVDAVKTVSDEPAEDVKTVQVSEQEGDDEKTTDAAVESDAEKADKTDEAVDEPEGASVAPDTSSDKESPERTESSTDEQQDKPQKKPSKTTDNDAAQHDDELQKLIASKKYKLNIKESRANPLKQLLLVAGFMVLALIAAFLLIDTKTIDTDIELPFHIFGKEEMTDKQSDLPPESPTPKAQEKTEDSESVSIGTADHSDTMLMKDAAATGADKLQFVSSTAGVTFTYPDTWKRYESSNSAYTDYVLYTWLETSDYMAQPAGVGAGGRVAVTVDESTVESLDDRVTFLKGDKQEGPDYIVSETVVVKQAPNGIDAVYYESVHTSWSGTYEFISQGRLYQFTLSTSLKEQPSETSGSTPTLAAFTELLKTVEFTSN